MGEDRTSMTPLRARFIVMMASLVAGILLLLGILALLRAGGEAGTPTLTVFSVHPLTGLAWTILGLVGVAMSTSTERAQRYLVGSGVVLVAWAVLCLILNGEPSDLFIRDRELIVLNGLLGLVALVAASSEIPVRLIGTTE